MNVVVDLPLVKPLYSTYHYQGSGAAIIKNNPTILNWYMNEVMDLSCEKRFLTGFTTPEISIPFSTWMSNPHFERQWCTTRFAKGHINYIIREMLNQGYYVVFGDMDDYYIEGKSWYKNRHFIHDGLICGCNKDDKTFCVYAYDINWIYRKFWTSQKSFNKARESAFRQGKSPYICGLKVKDKVVEFSPKAVCIKLKEYLDSDMTKYPVHSKGTVYGIVVHEYIAKYVSKLKDGSIPYERMDRRVFRVIWEHKRAMLERIRTLEKSLNIGEQYGNEYEKIVAEADTMRMIYASHNIRRRDSVLPVIIQKLLTLSVNENKILNLLVKAIEKELDENAVETPKK